ncbi:hypothetical protein FisN_17Hh202 [Fistulifera solaris]|uniref:Translin n=1 Tax=Fistulifera solaris TaxID=1519565 RepID=A0A1Z5JGZ1_FISSO|nr:hypothetical protein FisN_17Hh202 [Fistulifera solaris]|eukprot:GAX13264.1 hypothetical protein FisN_17Hh202 [Fistulifera solaris]
MPSLPLKYAAANVLDLSALSARITAVEARRQEAFELWRHLQVVVNVSKEHVGEKGAMESLRTTCQHVLLSTPEREPRLANLSNRMEDIVRLESFQHFLETGTLVSLSELTRSYPTLTDEEYLAGAVMGLTQELRRYGLGRATVRDVASVKAAASLVTECQNFLLQMDFRNGPLRRKYDGVKYSLQALETLLYELSITGATVDDTSYAETSEAKRIKTETAALIPTEELQALKDRMDHRDELRESLIKKSRDGQKAAKQSIFALHRGDTKRTRDLLNECRDCIQKDLMPIVREEPFLRTAGSFTGVLEEYVEARLFGAWLYGNAFFSDGTCSSKVSGVFLQMEDFTEVALEPEEYLGGLCDLTGEIGRYAVQRGTARDKSAVELSLQGVSSVLSALQSLERCPVQKKLEGVRRTEEKLERMLYDMSLSEAAGGRIVPTTDSNQGEDEDGNRDD